jgi:DNA-binding transcriptional regulator YiaG
MTISAALKRWRSERSFSQATAAAKLAVSLRTYQDWEQSRREPTGNALSSLWPVIGRILHPRAALNGSFAELMKTYRKQTRQNRGEAAKTLNVSAGAIQDWEQERRVPGGATVVRLLPFFEAAAEEWKAARSRPPSTEEAGLIEMLRSRGPKRSRKRVFADPKEGRKAMLALLRKARLELERSRDRRWQELVEQDIWRLKRELLRYKRKIAKARAKAARAKRRMASRKPRRTSPVLSSTPK